MDFSRQVARECVDEKSRLGEEGHPMRLDPQSRYEKFRVTSRVGVLRFGVLLLLCIPTFIFMLTYTLRWLEPRSHGPKELLQEPSWMHPLNSDIHSMWRERVHYASCAAVNASEDHRFEFNFTSEDAAANTWHLNDSYDGAPHHLLHGSVFVRRGDLDQPSDLEVRVSVKSADKADLNNVHFHQSNSALDITYSLTEDEHSCTEVTVFILIRPWPKRFLDYFEIHTDVLNVDFESSLNWEINNLIISLPHGNLWSDSDQPYVDPLVTHNMSISSVDGLMFGWYIPGKHIQLRNENGGIGGWIAPMIDQTFPFEPQSISVSTADGEIKMGFVGEIWPDKALTHLWNIHSLQGNITTGVPHGAHTNVSSISGNLKTTIWTYGVASPQAKSEIHTSTHTGYNYVSVHGPPYGMPDGYGSSLFNTYSSHDVIDGELWVSYPSLWWGELEGNVEQGKLRFWGSSLDYVMQDERHVKARRGKQGFSQMSAHIDSGLLTVQVGRNG